MCACALRFIFHGGAAAASCLRSKRFIVNAAVSTGAAFLAFLDNICYDGNQNGGGSDEILCDGDCRLCVWCGALI